MNISLINKIGNEAGFAFGFILVGMLLTTLLVIVGEIL